MRGFLRSLFLLSPFGAALPGCASEPALPSDSGELAADLDRELATRADALAARRTEALSASSEPWDLWEACLETCSPAVLAARRAAATALASGRAAGAIDAELAVEHVGSGSDRETEITLAFDLPGLVGAGRQGAQRARAEVVAARAQAELAAVTFRTRHDLERALASLAVARELEHDLAGLEAGVQPEARRLELLDQRGWLAPDQAAAARVRLHHLAVMRIEQQVAAAAARADVATIAGLPSDSPWLDDGSTAGVAAVTRRTEQRIAAQSPDTRTLLELHPELRRVRFDVLGAEAEVRIASAEQWPALVIGPKAKFTADDVLWGGVLALELPWPPAANAAVDAARNGRAAARDALIAALAAARQRIVRRRTELGAAELELHEHGVELLAASEVALRAGQARFLVDAGALGDWSDAIDQRAKALVAHAAALERWLVATFDLSEAEGAR